MRSISWSQVVMGLAFSLGCSVVFAQVPGEAIYKAKCQSCHGATGMADTTVGKALKVKPVSDPTVKKYSETAMIDATKNGMGKMKPFKDKLTEAEIKDSVARFRSFIK